MKLSHISELVAVACEGYAMQLKQKGWSRQQQNENYMDDRKLSQFQSVSGTNDRFCNYTLYAK